MLYTGGCQAGGLHGMLYRGGSKTRVCQAGDVIQMGVVRQGDVIRDVIQRGMSD